MTGTRAGYYGIGINQGKFVAYDDALEFAMQQCGITSIVVTEDAPDAEEFFVHAGGLVLFRRLDPCGGGESVKKLNLTFVGMVNVTSYGVFLNGTGIESAVKDALLCEDAERDLDFMARVSLEINPMKDTGLSVEVDEA